VTAPVDGAEPLLVAEGLERVHRAGAAPAVTAVAGATFELRPGELVVLAGPSGSGKTTLLGLLTGLELPDAGRVRGSAAGDRDWGVQGLLPQALGLLEELTLEENVALPLRLARRADTGQVADLLSRLGLGDARRRLPRQTSLGEQQRAGVARALVLRPPLLVLDEPTAHQDAASRALVIEVLARAAFEGAAVLVATHDPALREVAHRRFRMAGGVLHEEPSPVDDRAG
jgi:putative ABC transport system ATP-binding protein